MRLASGHGAESAGRAERAALELIDQFEDQTYVEAMRTLFGLAAGTRRSSLTERRRRAAGLLVTTSTTSGRASRRRCSKQSPNWCSAIYCVTGARSSGR